MVVRRMVSIPQRQPGHPAYCAASETEVHFYLVELNEHGREKNVPVGLRRCQRCGCAIRAEDAFWVIDQFEIVEDPELDDLF